MKRPSMTLYHANARGTGTALCLELHPAGPDADGFILTTIAQQKSPIPEPTFDWENAIAFRLGILDLSKVLQVLHGWHESIDEGKWLYCRTDCRTDNGCTVVRFTHRIEPVIGYVLDVSHRPNEGEEIVSMHFALTESEAFALAEVIEQAMLPVAFGVPS